LELLAATLAVRSFAKEKSGIKILLKLDNTIAVAYINRMGRTTSPMLHITFNRGRLVLDMLGESRQKRGAI